MKKLFIKVKIKLILVLVIFIIIIISKIIKDAYNIYLIII